MAAKRREVRWSRAAREDLALIVNRIAADRPWAAAAVLDRFERKTRSLEVHPDRGRVVPELLKQGIAAYRELLQPPWRIVYRLDRDTVFVLAVFDGRRNLEDVLLDRLIRPADPPAGV